MNTRIVLILLAWALCIGTVWGIVRQRQELLSLRAQETQRALLARPPTESSVLNGSDVSQDTVSSVESASPELLRLRREVTRLTARKRELASVSEETERLRAQLASSQTNVAFGIRLPPGYMRKANAQFVGYSTPESTLQSFLWAIQHHDVNRFLEALSPAEAQVARDRLGTGSEPEKGFFNKAMDALPGMAIQSRQDLPDGSVELQVEIDPGMPAEKILLRPTNGEWKVESRF